jgi:STAS domain
LAEPSAQSGPPNRPLLERRDGVLVIGGSIAPTDAAALCERARPLLVELVATDGDSIICDAGRLRADVAAVDVVARLALAARRLDRGMRLRRAPSALRELLALAGLADVVPCGPESGLDPRR